MLEFNFPLLQVTNYDNLHFQHFRPFNFILYYVLNLPYIQVNSDMATVKTFLNTKLSNIFHGLIPVVF